MLRLSGGTYQLKIILQILPAVEYWYLKRTNYVGVDQRGLVTLGNARKPNLVTAPSKESKEELKTTKALFALAMNSDDELDELLAKSSLEKFTSVRLGHAARPKC